MERQVLGGGGEGILIRASLIKDAIEDLEQQTKIVQLMMHGYDRIAIEAGEPELATDSDKLQKTVSELASKSAG